MSEQGQQLLSRVPILPLRDVVVYPHMVIPLFVGREKSIVALDEAMNSDKQILLVAQKQNLWDGCRSWQHLMSLTRMRW